MTRAGDTGDGPAFAGGDGPEATARQIADAVDVLSALWWAAAQEASMPLSPHQLRGLRLVEAAPGLNLTALAQGMDIGLPTASRLCDRLEAAGLVERALHPHRRREVRLSLTRHGRRVLTEVASHRAEALAATLATMQAAERTALVRGMSAFLRARRHGSGYDDGFGTRER
ncbi:MarR family winged helix-turn-helix transcriptional regulator [Streptomyces sp. NPDC046759]|uniref:MarR family winged helix-turn-helix transcriptional regulator n=1 Tax=Streptomyces sp. NPDC046759 TaxID=3155019 RepID=UPI0033DB4A93